MSHRQNDITSLFPQPEQQQDHKMALNLMKIWRSSNNVSVQSSLVIRTVNARRIFLNNVRVYLNKWDLIIL